MSNAFESAIEKLARILGRQYGVNVVFEGNQPKTDGKTIFLPYFEKLTPELKADMNGYLDHEVGHIKFTEIDSMAKCKGQMHKFLLNAVEDSRIEREMIKEFPGCVFNLQPMNEKLRAEMDKKWKDMPWPVRTIVGVRDLMDGRSPVIDADTERYMDVVRDAAKELRHCETTEELRVATEVIIKKIIEENEEEKKEEEKKSGGKGKGKGEGKPSLEDMMLTAGEGDPAGKEFEKHIIDVGSMFKEEVKDVVKKEEKVSSRMGYEIKPKDDTPNIPVTTRFDKVTDHSGKGRGDTYAKLKREVMPLIAPIRSQLERVLKVKENAKWRIEKERGAINTKSLANLATNKAYRTPFKEFTKTETNNVAVEVLCDMSGSMGGSRIRSAKMTAIAMAEALKGLDIPFEVTGFYSIHDRGIQDFASKLGDVSRFNRKSERLDLHVFKSFDCVSLTGIEKMESYNNNPDSEAVKWAAQRLAARPQKRKILMVLSDGQPAAADGGWGLLQTDLKRKIKECAKAGIEVVGIGIETDYVKEFYPQYVIIQSEKDLPKQAMGKLAKMIQK